MPKPVVQQINKKTLQDRKTYLLSKFISSFVLKDNLHHIRIQNLPNNLAFPNV